MTYQARNTRSMKPARVSALALLAIWTLFSPMGLMAQAKPGEKQAEKIAERVEAQETKSSAQEDLVKEIADAAKKAGEDHPDDADAVKEEVKDKIDEIIKRKSGGGKHGGANNKEIREWAKKLKRELLDGNYLMATAAATPGETQGEKIAERVEAEETKSSAQEDLVEEIADTAREAGKDNPNDPQAVKDAVKAKLDEIRDRPSTRGKPGGKNNKEISDWVKKLKRTLLGGGYVSFTPSSGSRILMTGTVVEGQEATLTVVSPNGQALEGVVVDVNDERYVSDDRGRVVFIATSTAGFLSATLPALLEGSPAQAEVLSVFDGMPMPPTVEHAPPHVMPGGEVTITGNGFEGSAAGNTVSFGDTQAPVLASSPTEVVVAVPESMQPGSHDVAVETPRGSSDTRSVDVVTMSVHSDASVLRRGKKGKAAIQVTGTDQPVTIEVVNLAPQTVSLGDAEQVTLRTSGGDENCAKFKFEAVNPGAFRITARIIQDAARASSDR